MYQKELINRMIVTIVEQAISTKYQANMRVLAPKNTLRHSRLRFVFVTSLF
jgi:hypothetical protein